MHKFFLTLLIICCSPAINAWVEIETDGNVWAINSPDKSYRKFVAQLQLAQLIDNNHKWIGGQDILVVTGNLLGDSHQSIQLLDLIISLEAEAKASGGGVLVLLGEHDVRNLTDNFFGFANRLSPQFAESESTQQRNQHLNQTVAYYHSETNTDAPAQTQPHTEKPLVNLEALKLQFEKNYPRGFFAMSEAFSPNGKYGQWLLEKNFLIKVNKTLFAYAGLPPELKGQTLDEINKGLTQTLRNSVEDRQQLIDGGRMFGAAPVVAQANNATDKIPTDQKPEVLSPIALFEPTSPMNYRGELVCHSYYQSELLRNTLASFGADKLVIGKGQYDSAQISTRHEEQVFFFPDQGKLENFSALTPQLLKLSTNRIQAFDGDGVEYQPATASFKPIDYPEGLAMDELLTILKSAPIEKMEPLSTGITKPFRLTFKDTPVPVRALFKSIDTFPGIEKRKTKSSDEKYADRYHFDIAAYRLSEAMGFHLIPAVVEREINGTKGIVQFWVEDSHSYLEAEDNNISFQGVCELRAQRNMLRIFDLLIFNHDRNKSNMLFDPINGQLIWIDHSRALSAHKRLPGYINKKNIKITPQVRKALNALTKDQLNDIMKGLLNKDQINAILYRRKLILKLDPE